RTTAPAATPTAAVDPLTVRAIYLNPDSIIDDATFNGLLALAGRTEINAMVLDIKDETGWLYHDSAVALAREIGAVRPRYDLRRRLATLKAHGICAIARIVCMQDPTLATRRPALAVRNSKTGGIWENDNGAAWVNALRPEVWRYNTAVAVEAAVFGFDEIQYDYVRFPSDGDMAAIDLGAESTVATRTEAIYQGLKTTREALAPRGVPLAADIFGIVLVLPDDNNIGQQLEALAPVVDVLCPMIYPSHFPPGGLGWRVPNDHPYEVILESLQLGGERIDDAKRKFRPWLQDFSYGRGKDYGPEEVRAQIQATYDFGATGWMLWNANNTYTEGALLPEGW
ncbi:MAG: putative glycoside hydrolase, partial [Chloroflexota bacterium]|nr:putative glycoside hydrolase [Chloroflexota bacterium]